MFITQPKIFISSTIIDMPSERKAALKAVEKVGGFPLMSEHTIEAQSTDSLTACLEKVKESINGCAERLRPGRSISSP